MPKYKMRTDGQTIITCGNVKFAEWQPESQAQWPPIWAALCSAEGCTNFALDFREADSQTRPVCSEHGGREPLTK